MFKNLKKKIEQGVAQSKAAVSGLTKGDDSFDRSGSSEYIGKPLAESTPQKDGNQVASVFQDVNSPVTTDGQKFQGVSRVPIGQLVDIPLSEGFDSTHYETASERSSVQGDETPRGLRSRASSISSLTSDSSFFPSVSYSHSYYVPSDAESEIEETSVNLSAVSKEDLYAFVKRVERRAFKYKSKFMELAAAYKDMMQEREKLKMTMAQCQDRAFRRMSELREQIQLDQIAKRDLEENFRLLLDEKDEYMKILQLQVKLLKDGKEIPEELQAKLASKQAKAEAASPTAGGDNKGNISTNEEIELLKSKIKRQDGLLQKCKETITSYKEKVSQLSLDKQDLLGKLELRSKASEKSADQAPDQVSKLQAQIQEARKVIEQLETDKETQIASVKQQEELAQLKEQIQTLTAENSSLKLKTEKFEDEVENLRKANQEQLEKARSIMQQLKDEKKLAVEQAEERIRHVEQSLEEKEKFISRDNTEAASVSQQESDQSLNEKVQAAVEERDNYWNLKMAAQEEAQNDLLQCKDKEKALALTLLQEELSQKLQEKEKEITLAVEESELQKVTNVTSHNEQRDELLQKMEEANAEKIELSYRLEKLQEDLENQVSELQKRLREGEVEHSRLVEELRANHEAVLDNERSALSEKAAGDLELVRQNHALEVEALVEKQEKSLQEFNSNTESQYKTQMEDLQVNLENLLAVTKEELEEVRASHSQVQAKLADTEQLLATAQMDLDSRKKEHDSQLEELYASINGKGDENEELRRVIEEIRSQLGDRDNKLEEASLRLTQAQEETIRLREQVEATQGESKTEMEGLFLEREDLIQKNQALTAKESNSNGIIKNLEESNLELTSQSQILLEELRSVREELTTSLSSTRFLQREKLAIEKEFQRKLINSQEEADQSKSQALHVLEEQLTLLREEHESLFSNVEISQTKIEELEKHLEEVSKEKEMIESKGQELEVQVNQLQDVVQGLESQKSEVEGENSSLEEKLKDLEMTVANLKASKEEWNVQQETLVHQQAVEQQTSESRISDLTLQTNRLNEKVGELVTELSAKDEENAALKAAADDSSNVVRSLEYQINQLNVELQSRIQQNEHMDATLAATLAAHLEQFEQFKIGAVEETKQLKESIDTLTEKLNQKQLECEEMRNSFALEQDSLIKKHNEHISQLGEEMKSTEQVLKEQLETKQAEFKDKVAKLKEEFENKMQEKDTDFEDRMKELMSQKDLGIEDLNKNFDRLKEEQLRSLEEKHLTDIDEILTEWQAKCQRLDDEHRLKLDAARSQFQDQITDLQQKLDISLQESASHKNDCDSIQSELESSRSQLKEVAQKYTEDIEALNLELNKKNDQLYKAMTDVETVQFDLMSERNLYEGLRLQKQSLEEQLQEKESKLESMFTEQEHLSCQVVQQAEKAEELQAQKNIISEELDKVVEQHKKDVQEKEDLLVQTSSLSEQLETKENSLESLSREIEHLRKQLAQQVEISEELQSLKNDLSKQLVEVIEDHNTNLQEKDTVLNDMCQKLQLLEVEHASVGEMLNVNLASIASETVAGSLRENIERLMAEKDALQHNLETNVSNVTALQEELQSLRGNSDKVVSDLTEKHAKEVELLKSDLMENHAKEVELLKSDLMENHAKEVELLKSDLMENHAKEVELLKSSYNSQISQLSSNDADLQSKKHHLETQLTELNEKFQESIENYETRLEEEKSKLERQETSLKEQMNVLKQQLYEAQSQAEVSSNELQFSLQQKVKEGEEKLLTQLQSHSEEMETLKQETEQKAKDLKQKYIAKLREIQSQAKSSVEELDRSLQAEKATKEELDRSLQAEKATKEELDRSLQAEKATKEELDRSLQAEKATKEELDRSLQAEKATKEELDRSLQAEKATKEELDRSLQAEKATKEELDRSLQAEKATKEEISTELSKANSQIQQLMEDSETLSQRIVQLEDTVRETTAQIAAKDDELQKLKADLAAYDKNTETALQESQFNLQETTDKLKEAKSKLTEKESDLHNLDQQLQEKLLLLEQKDSQILALQGRFQELEEAGDQEKEKHELEIQEKDIKVSLLENNLEETHKLLAESESAHAELKERVKSSMLDLERVHGGQQQLQDELAQVSADKKQLQSELLDTKTLLDKSLEEHALVTRELESRLQDQASQKEQDRQNGETELKETQTNLAAELAESKSLNENIKQDYEAKLKELHKAHAVELTELSSAIEAQSSTKVAEYKRKAEAFISQMKKQLQDEKAASFHKQQEKITQLEETILVLTKEVDELKQSKLTLIADNERILQSVKSELDAEVKLKQAVIEESYKKEQDSANTELELKRQIDLLLSEKNALLEKVSVIEKGGNDFKVQYAAEIEQLRSKNEQLQKDFEAMKSEKDEELTDLDAKLAETVQKLQKERHAALEDQANEHSSKLKMLVKEMNSQLGVKDREFEATFREVLEKSERTEQDMMRKHNEDLNELRKEISERDERIQELHVEYKTQIQELELQSREVQAAFQKSAAAVEDSLSQQKVSPLSSHMGQFGEQSKSELDEITSRQGREWSAVPKPVVTAPVRQTFDASDPDFSLEMQDLELHNIDLQAQVSHLNGELSHFKVKERDLLKKIDKLERAGKGVAEYDDPAASIDGLYLNHSDSASFREPTEFEYLKNILYEYMMGKETKTLAKVIATVVRFSDEQTRNVVARSDTKVLTPGGKEEALYRPP